MFMALVPYHTTQQADCMRLGMDAVFQMDAVLFTHKSIRKGWAEPSSFSLYRSVVFVTQNKCGLLFNFKKFNKVKMKKVMVT